MEENVRIIENGEEDRGGRRTGLDSYQRKARDELGRVLKAS